MARHIGHRAVVLGGSITGLLAARVLSECYAEVFLVDRDQLTGTTGYRRGVPHGRHAHGLLARGQQILEQHFPGLTDGLRAAGVVTGDFSGDNRWYINGKRLRPSHSGLLCVPATRPMLEAHIRSRVQAIANVTFVDRHDVVGLATTPDRSRVVGARVRASADVDGTEVTLSADLVIDTTGRGSRTPVWLRELGYAAAEEELVKINLGYSTRHFLLREDIFGTDLAIIPVASPAHPRGAFFYPTPGDRRRVELTLTGMVGDHPPTDPDGFLEFARSLPVPDIYQAVRDAKPLDDVVGFKFPANVRRHYEKLTAFPEGYLVMGDAVCSFNPLYGQGMSVAALESLTLGRHLRDGVTPQAQRFFQDVAKDVDAPWQITTGGDLAFAAVEGKRTLRTRIGNAYLARLHAGATQDASLTNAFIRAAGLVDPPQALMRSSVVLRVLRGGKDDPGEQLISGLRPPADGSGQTAA